MDGHRRRDGVQDVDALLPPAGYQPQLALASSGLTLMGIALRNPPAKRHTPSGNPHLMGKGVWETPV